MLKEGARAAGSADQVVFDLQIRLQASKKKCNGLSTALQNAKIASPDHVPGVKEKTDLADTDKPKLQGELRSLRAELESYRCE